MMKRRLCLILSGLCLLHAVTVFGLSTPIGRDISFPKDYDPQKAKAIRHVIEDQRFKFVDGIVSYWPPDFGTRLSYEGDANSLNEFLAALRKISGISLRFVLYHGRDEELRRDSAWQLDFSQARPDELTVYLNLNAKHLDWDKVLLPKIPAHK